MTRFSDESVGGAVYRVLYDTPSISRICYELWVVPVLALYSAADTSKNTTKIMAIPMMACTRITMSVRSGSSS